MAFDLNQLPEKVDDLRYCVLDYNDPSQADYFWPPLVFLDIFSSPCADVKIGSSNIQMPLDWSVVVGDKHGGDLEVLRLIDINDKDFDVFVFNPISGYMPNFLPIDIVNVFSDVKWCFPKLKNNHFLAVPLNNSPAPECAFFIKDVSKNADLLDIRQLI
jgi:hypothetical protein